jgi:PadR family transcriptional regulator PadR
MIFQVGATLLDACVLSVLAKGDTYGYILTQTLREVLDISESTLYPVLRRLQRDGALSTYDSPFQGRNRRYYTITEAGRIKMEAYRQEWRRYRERVEQLMEGGVSFE